MPFPAHRTEGLFKRDEVLTIRFALYLVSCNQGFVRPRRADEKVSTILSITVGSISLVSPVTP